MIGVDCNPELRFLSVVKQEILHFMKGLFFYFALQK